MLSPSHLRMRLAEIDNEVEILELKLRLLTAERQKITDDLDSIVYPVLTLPAEITGEIFSHYVDKPHIGRLPAPPQSHPPGYGPLTLASVCRRWRHIAIALRSLWGSVRVYPESHSNIKNLLALLKRWLPRAGTHPLDLHIFRSRSRADSSKILDVIFPYASQWRSVGITLRKPNGLAANKLHGRVSQTTKLVLDLSNNLLGVVSAFQDALSLREVHLSGESLPRISLPWIQLSHLEFSDADISTCLDVLKKTPNLKVLTAAASVSGNDDIQALLPLSLPHLHSLRLGGDLFLTCLTLPALKTLEVTYPAGNAMKPYRLHGIAHRSAWSLHTVRLWNVGTSFVPSSLEDLPSLEQLEIHNHSESQDIAPLVAWLTRYDSLLPALRTLKLEVPPLLSRRR